MTLLCSFLVCSVAVAAFLLAYLVAPFSFPLVASSAISSSSNVFDEVFASFSGFLALHLYSPREMWRGWEWLNKGDAW